ncbi:MAG: hypothetical protein M0005_03195 [Actinomycetota bacterium]|nr:hypothetical protein [Actinomycetota bacterium]
MLITRTLVARTRAQAIQPSFFEGTLAEEHGVEERDSTPNPAPGRAPPADLHPRHVGEEDVGGKEWVHQRDRPCLEGA